MKKIIFGIGMVIACMVGVAFMWGMTLVLFLPLVLVIPIGLIAAIIDGKDYPKKKLEVDGDE